jgi:putative ABC transport system permease protein
MRALHRKLLRDLSRMRGQAIAVAVLVACAVAVLVGSLSVERALRRTVEAYYAEQGFADVFAPAARAPEHVAGRVAALPGVAEVDTRVVGDATVDLPGADAPATARLASLAPGAPLNRVHVRAGRGLAPGARGEALVSEGFAAANGLLPGDALALVVNGRWQRVRIAGIALSPEFVISVPPGGLLPDDRHFGVVWMDRDALAAAFDMEGAFNELSVRLAPGARQAEVIAGIDRLLSPYGGLGAYGRDLQLSHRFVSDEISQLRVTATATPAIFLAVAAFLLAVAMSRIVATERPQIGTLKALGYSSAAVAAHYARLVVAIAAAGSVLGFALGDLIGRGLAVYYQAFYRFPTLAYAPAPDIMLLGAAIAVAAALAGASGAVRRAARLPPAEAMRPEPPPTFRATALERAGLRRLLAPAARMALRNVARRPARALLSTAGLASAVAVLITGAFSLDAMDFMMDLAFARAQRQDATVSFTRPVSTPAVHELRAIPGVLAAEPFRTVPVTLRSGPRSYRTALTGVAQGAELQRIVGVDGRIQPVPPAGLVLSTHLAELLGVGAGDAVRVEVLEGRRPARDVRVAGTVEDVLGVSATMSLAALDRLLGDRALSGAWLATDPAHAEAAYAALRERPRVAGVTLRTGALEAFDAFVAQFMLVYTAVLVAFAVAIAAGVVFNTARVAFAERAHEIATLRVLGFTRGESFVILLGELGAELALALPLGCVLGWLLAAALSAALRSDLYRIPVVIEPATYAFAMGVTVAAALVTVLALRTWIARLDLVGALKAME